MKSRRTLATLYGVGLCGFAPGTAGSAVAAMLAYGILLVPYGWAVLPIAAALFTYLGTQSATRYMHDQGTAHDPGEIIVDELAGQWFTYSLWHMLLIWFGDAGGQMDTICHEPLFLIAGFFLFRFFDIVKPWPISWADKNIHGGFGVMFDDLLAAIPAGICLYGFYAYSDYFLAMMK
ncbi:MAG: phosphatidylglycerophosphatase A [Rickettsiales bacterium]